MISILVEEWIEDDSSSTCWPMGQRPWRLAVAADICRFLINHPKENRSSRQLIRPEDEERERESAQGHKGEGRPDQDPVTNFNFRLFIDSISIYLFIYHPGASLQMASSFSVPSEHFYLIECGG